MKNSSQNFLEKFLLLDFPIDFELFVIFRITRAQLFMSNLQFLAEKSSHPRPFRALTTNSKCGARNCLCCNKLMTIRVMIMTRLSSPMVMRVETF